MIKDRSFTNRDIVSIRKEILELIRSKTSNWTDFNESDLGMIFVEVLAGVSDFLSFYLDNQALEQFLSTAKQEKNIRGILETINYKLESVRSAIGKVRVGVVNSTDDDNHFVGYNFVLPKYTRIATYDNPDLEYVTTEAVSFKKDDKEKEVAIAQGIRHRLLPTVGELKRTYKYQVADHKVPLDLVLIEDSNWEKVEDAFLEIEGGQKYSVHIDNKDCVYILFTFDFADYLSANERDTLEITYIESLGTGGIVQPMALTNLLSNILDETGQDITSSLTVVNDEMTYGAFDKVDLNLAKANGKNYVRTMDRIILLSDFDALIRKEPYILKCNAFDWRRDITIVSAPHVLKAWVVTVDGVSTNQIQLDELVKRLEKKTVAMTKLYIVSAEYVDISIEVEIAVRGNNDYREDIRQQVEESLKEKYSVLQLEFGDVIDEDRVSADVARVSESIKHIHVEGFEEPYRLSQTQFPNITNIDVKLVGDIYGNIEG